MSRRVLRGRVMAGMPSHVIRLETSHAIWCHAALKFETYDKARSRSSGPVLSSFRFEQRNERGQRHRCDAVLAGAFSQASVHLGLSGPRSLRTNGSCFEQSFRSGHNSCPPARRRDTARIASNKLDSQPLTRFFGDRDTKIVVGPVPNGVDLHQPRAWSRQNDRRYQRRCPCVETARFTFSASHGQWGI